MQAERKAVIYCRVSDPKQVRDGHGLSSQTDAILAACAFQDLTGQRIARTLDNIRRAESELADTLKRMGLKIDITPAQRAAAVGADDKHAHSQADIDALFG